VTGEKGARRMTGAEDDKKMPLLDHIVELRQRLLYSSIGFVIAFIGCFYFWQPIFEFMAEPLLYACRETEVGECRIIYTSLVEPFFTQVKIAAFAALCLSFPIIANQMWKFVAPGLYKNERHAFLPFIIATPIMFTVGAGFLYYVLMPMAWRFFLSYQSAGGPQDMAIEVMPKIGEYVDLVMKLVFAFGVCFELPVLLTLLAKVGIVSSQGLKDKRRYAIVMVTVVAAIFTPPDAFSMLSLAVPMICLYEISILLARMVEKKRAAQSAEPSPAGSDVAAS
jgi:sec-independent protein translocase protein TatC